MVESIIVRPDARRDAAAATLATQLHTWPVVTLKTAHGAFPAGTQFLAAPGSKGQRYLCNAVVCQCADYERGGHVCEHVRAVLLAGRKLAVGVEAPAPKPRTRYTDLFPECAVKACHLDPEDGELFCRAHRLVDAF